MRDLSSPARDWIHVPSIQGGFLTTGSPGKSQPQFLHLWGGVSTKMLGLWRLTELRHMGHSEQNSAHDVTVLVVVYPLYLLAPSNFLGTCTFLGTEWKKENYFFKSSSHCHLWLLENSKKDQWHFKDPPQPHPLPRLLVFLLYPGGTRSGSQAQR